MKAGDPQTFPETDVIVIGAGGSGLAAAVSAAEEGLAVVVLEKRPEPGGTTGIAVGSFTGCCTPQQRRAGIDDDPGAHNEDAGKFARPDIEVRGNRDLRGRFLARSAETLEWLMGLGLDFQGPSPEPPNRVPRMHNVIPGAKAYIAVLQARLLRLGGAILCETTVDGLLRDGERVVGVTARTGGMRAVLRARRGVVLATGDYAASEDLIAEHRGEPFRSIEGINPHATGDGHRLVQSVGGRLLNMDITYGPEIRFVAPSRRPFTQILPVRGPLVRIMGWLLPALPRRVVQALARRLLVTWQHPEDAVLTDGGILVNCRGDRFCDETDSPGREIAISRQPGRVAFILLDDRLARRYSAWPHFISTAPEVAYAYVHDYLRLRPDVAVEGRRLADVAAARRIPAVALEKAVAAWNRAVRDRKADPLGRSTAGHEALEGGRWVLLGPAKAYFTTTEGGAAIDRRFRVLDGRGEPIEGLHAVGQVGLGGQILWGHGLHMAWAMTSGRLAGKSLAAGPLPDPRGTPPGNPAAGEEE